MTEMRGTRNDGEEGGQSISRALVSVSPVNQLKSSLRLIGGQQTPSGEFRSPDNPVAMVAPPPIFVRAWPRRVLAGGERRTNTSVYWPISIATAFAAGSGRQSAPKGSKHPAPRPIAVGFAAPSFFPKSSLQA